MLDVEATAYGHEMEAMPLWTPEGDRGMGSELQSSLSAVRDDDGIESAPNVAEVRWTRRTGNTEGTDDMT